MFEVTLGVSDIVKATAVLRQGLVHLGKERLRLALHLRHGTTQLQLVGISELPCLPVQQLRADIQRELIAPMLLGGPEKPGGSSSDWMTSCPAS